MKNSKISYLILILLSIFSVVSCKKDFSTNQTGIISDQTKNKDNIPPYPLDWENINAMPTPPGTPYSVLVPWASGSNQEFSPDIAYDFKNSEGWELVYNVFNSTQSLTSPNFFVLYNRYRGLLRYYLYVPPGSANPSTYIEDSLSLSGSASSSMLNFIGQDIITVGSNQASASKIDHYQLQSTGAWYVSQFEIAYDPNMPNLTYQQLNMVWSTSAINITSQTLDGVQTGTITGTLGTPASGFNFSGLATTAGKGALEATGLAIFSNNTAQQLGLPSGVYSSIKSGLSSGLSGVVQNVFNSIFGGTSTNTQEVNLTLNTNISLNGQITSKAGIGNPTLAIPGISNSQSAPGYSPGYNNVMGIFNLTGVPTVTEKTTTTKITQDGSTMYQYANLYTLNASQLFSTLFVSNPAVINSSSTGAQIQNEKAQVVLILSPVGSSPSATQGVLENVGNYTAYTGSAVSATYVVPRVNPTNQVAVRVSFDVVPNNGAPKSTIVKTFWANVVNQ